MSDVTPSAQTQASADPSVATPPASSHVVAVSSVKDVLPLSEHAEDVLAATVGHELALVTDDKGAPLKTVQQVLNELKDDPDELAITLEYGTGESGVDQASWNIEVTSLQRAFMRKQKHAEISELSTKIDQQITAFKSHVDSDWIDRTASFRELMLLFEHSVIIRQQIDDYHHHIFSGDHYMKYLEAVLSAQDPAKLMNAAANLVQVVREMQLDYEKLINPANVDNAALAQEIIASDGDMDKLAHTLERDYPYAVFRKNVRAAGIISSVFNTEFLKNYKLWAHSFDLNLREVLATEQTTTDGRISDKSRIQLKEMLAAGAEQINQILRVLN